jgi:hypothetical protein
MHELPTTQSIDNAPVLIAPDGSTVRPLCHLSGLGSFAHFQLEPGEVAKAVSHATVQERAGVNRFGVLCSAPPATRGETGRQQPDGQGAPGAGPLRISRSPAGMITNR